MDVVDDSEIRSAADVRVGARLSAYRLVRLIGQGGVGMVWEAEHVGLAKRFALKMLRVDASEDPAVVARFVREARVMARFRHPNAVDVTDVGEVGGVPFLVMELLSGESLYQRMRRERKLSPTLIADVAIPVMAALSEAHKSRIIHRDIKPGNIILSQTPEGQLWPVLLDFGIAAFHEDWLVHEAPTVGFVGTASYAAPEQLRDSRSADARSDQYSLGVVMFEALTGRRAFSGKNFEEIRARVLAGDIEHEHVSDDVPHELLFAIERAIHVDPKMRWPSFKEFALAIMDFASPATRALYGSSMEWGDDSSPRANVTAPSMDGEASVIDPEAPTVLHASFNPLPTLPPAPPRSRAPRVLIYAAVVVLAVVGVSMFTHRSPAVSFPPPPALPQGDAISPVAVSPTVVAQTPAVAPSASVDAPPDAGVAVPSAVAPRTHNAAKMRRNSESPSQEPSVTESAPVAQPPVVDVAPTGERTFIVR